MTRGYRCDILSDNGAEPISQSAYSRSPCRRSEALNCQAARRKGLLCRRHSFPPYGPAACCMGLKGSVRQKVAPFLDGIRHGNASHKIAGLAPADTRLMMANIARKYCGFALVWLNEPGISGEIEPSARQPTAAADIISGQVRGNYLSRGNPIPSVSVR